MIMFKRIRHWGSPFEEPTDMELAIGVLVVVVLVLLVWAGVRWIM